MRNDRPDGLATPEEAAPASLLNDLLAQVTKCAAALESIEGRLQAAPASAGPAPALNVAEAAAHLHVSTKHLYRLVKEKRIPYSRVGTALRFTLDSLDQWLRDKEVPAVR